MAAEGADDSMLHDDGEEHVVVQRQDRRLLITKMVMENFKSYYGVQEVGPFHKCFSSVVGPNGSGKSNVIDAMLFVFGKRAKQIRQAKTADLIHKSENHNDLEYCRVSVYFVDIIDLPNGEYKTVEGSDFVLMREGRRDNSSLYYLDGKKATWKEVGALLRQRGIDLDHNRFLILQGEVEQIAMMKPKGQDEHDSGLLEYFEDIIGSDRYKEAIEAAGKEVEQTTEIFTEKLNRVKIVEKEKDALEPLKKEAEEFLTQENMLTAKKSTLYQRQQADCAKQVAGCQAKLQEAKTNLADMRESASGANKQMAEMGALHKTETKEYEKLQAAQNEAKQDFTLFERKDVQHHEDLKHAKLKDKKLEKSIAKDKSDLGALKAKAEALQTDVANNDKAIVQLKAQLEKEEEKLDEMKEATKGETAEIQKDLAKKQQQIQPLSKTLDEAQAVVDLKRAELEILTSGARTLQAQRDEAQSNLAKATETVKTRSAEIKTLRARKPVLEKDLKDATEQLQRLTAEEKPLAERVRQNKSKYEEAKSSSQQAQSRGKVLEALLAACKKGEVSGVYGRLGDLGTIDDRYDVAISTACGALNNIVVQTVQQAQWCVDYIRKHDIGRATFIILEKMNGLNMTAAEAFPENAPRLFDLVKPADEKFRSAFYHALRDTLVAKDLEQATRIAYQGGRAKHRVVTLEGALIDTSGTMSGGGNKVAKGGMSFKLAESLSPKDLAALEKEIEADVRGLRDNRESRATLESKVTSLKKELADLEMQLKRCEMDVEAMQTQTVELQALVADLEKKAGTSKEDEKKIAALQAALAADEKVYAKAKAAADVVEAEIKAIEEAILNVGGVKMRAQKAKVDGISEQIAALQSSITKANVEAKTSLRNVDKLQTKIQKDEQERQENKTHMEKIVEDFKAVEEGATKVMKAFEAASALLKEKEEALREIGQKYNDAKEAVSKLRTVEVDLEHKLEEAERTLKENQTKEKQWAKKLSGLKLHKIDGNDDEEAETDAPAAAAAAAAGAADATGEKKAEEAPIVELKTYTAEELAEFDVKALEYDITVLEERLAKMKPNMSAIKDFYRKESEYLARVAELDAVTEKRDALRAKFEGLRKQRLDTFMAGFSIITTKLKEMYQMITLGGDAELELVDRLNPFSEGIQFSVRPPKKSWKNISNLSGGEKTLSSLALVFALHHYKPTPLYVMDEIDAALDFKNVSIVANYIKERTKNAQFIIISLRNNMFELADRLIGIYKTDNATKSVTINPALVAAQAKESEDKGALKTTVTEKNTVAGRAPIAA